MNKEKITRVEYVLKNNFSHRKPYLRSGQVRRKGRGVEDCIYGNGYIFDD